jgi:hypothetical protein
MRAIEHNCACERDPDTGSVSGKCGAHRALLDQRFADGLLFARYLAGQLALEEFKTSS